MRRFVLLAVGLLGATAVLSVAGDPGRSSPAAAQAPGRTVTIEPAGPLAPGSMATASWSGFEPGPAYLYLCDVGNAALPSPEECFGETFVEGVTAANGEGSAQFQVRSALYPYELPIEGSAAVANLGGVSYYDCRSFGCGVVVTECSAAIRTELSAAAGYDLPQGEYGVYDDDPLVKISWQESVPGSPEYGLDAFLSPRPQPPPPPEPPGEPPIIATGTKVVVGGSDLGAAVFDEWNRWVAQNRNLQVVERLSTYVEGIDNVIAGDFDLALTALPATQPQVEQLAVAGQSLVYVPLAISATAIGYQAYPVLPVTELRVSANGATSMLWPEGHTIDGQVDGSTISSGPLGLDQGRCRPQRPRGSTVIYSRAGRSEAHAILSSWMVEEEPAYWQYGVTDTLPLLTVLAPQLTHSEVARALTSPKQTDSNKLSQYVRFAIVDTTWAAKYGADLALIQNAANQWVAPTADAIRETIEDSPIGPDNIVDVNARSADPLSYPLASVTYAAAPTTITADFTEEDAAAVREALRFYVSGEGQRMAEEKGYVPLTAELEARAEAAIAQIGSVKPAPPADTTTTAAATTTIATTTTAATAPASRTPAPSSGSGSGSGSGPSGSSSRPSTGAPSPSRTGTTVARPTTPASTPAGEPTGLAAGPELDETLSIRRQAEAEADTPEDVFSRMYDAMPFSPGLPTLAASGAFAAVAGQGINLWRAQRGRRPPTL